MGDYTAEADLLWLVGRYLEALARNSLLTASRQDSAGCQHCGVV